MKDALGETYEHAREIEPTSRLVYFAHSYVASKNTSIPDLDELLEKQKIHLKEILDRTNKGEYKVSSPSVTFTTPRKAGSDWDRIACEFERGEHKNGGVTFSPDGKISTRLPDIFYKSDGRIGNPNRDKPEVKITSTIKNATKESGIGFKKGALITGAVLAAGAVGWALWSRLRGKESERKEVVAR